MPITSKLHTTRMRIPVPGPQDVEHPLQSCQSLVRDCAEWRDSEIRRFGTQHSFGHPLDASDALQRARS